MKRLCRKCGDVSSTLPSAAVCIRKSCNEVNHWGSQAYSHVIKATWNMRRRSRNKNSTYCSWEKAPQRVFIRCRQQTKGRCKVRCAFTSQLLLLQPLHKQQTSNSSGRGRDISLTQVCTLTTDWLHSHPHCILDNSSSAWGFNLCKPLTLLSICSALFVHLYPKIQSSSGWCFSCCRLFTSHASNHTNMSFSIQKSDIAIHNAYIGKLY